MPLSWSSKRGPCASPFFRVPLKCFQLMIYSSPYSDAYEDFITIPGLAGTGVGSQYDWNLTYVSTETLGNRTLRLPQGRAVGGTTKINIMTWNHGSQSDYNRWETIGLEGWNWESLSGYFHKVLIHSMLIAGF